MKSKTNLTRDIEYAKLATNKTTAVWIHDFLASIEQVLEDHWNDELSPSGE